MTLQARTSIASITYAVPSGSVTQGTTYNITYNFLNNDEFVNVWYRNANNEKVELTLDSDFRIDISSGTNNVYGVCVLLKDIPNITSITLERSIAISQDIDFNNSTLYPSITEYAFDKLTAIAQDQDFKDYTIHAPADEVVTDPRKFELPPEEERLGKIVGFNGVGKVAMYEMSDGEAYTPATRTELGTVIIGDNLTLSTSGLINVPLADASTFGVAKIGTGINVTDGVISTDIAGVRTIAESANSTATLALGTANTAKTNSEAAKDTAEKTADLFDWYIDGAWTDARNLPVYSPNGGTYGNGKFVVCAYGDSNAYSTGMTNTQINWDTGDLPAQEYWTDAAYGAYGAYVIVSGEGDIAYSSDADSWSNATVSDPNHAWTRVVRLGNRFVTIGMHEYGYSLDGGQNWSVGTAPWTFTSPRITCSENNIFVVDGSGTTGYKASNGNTWTAITLPSGFDVIFFGNGKLVGLKGDKAYYSTDEASTWTTVTLTGIANTTVWDCGCFGGNRFVVVSSNTQQAIYSSDADDWNISAQTLPSALAYTKLIYGQGRFLLLPLGANDYEYVFKISMDIVQVLEDLLA